MVLGALGFMNDADLKKSARCVTYLLEITTRLSNLKKYHTRTYS